MQFLVVIENVADAGSETADAARELLSRVVMFHVNGKVHLGHRHKGAEATAQLSRKPGGFSTAPGRYVCSSSVQVEPGVLLQDTDVIGTERTFVALLSVTRFVTILVFFVLRNGDGLEWTEVTAQHL